MNSLGPSIDLSTCVSAARLKTATGLNLLNILINLFLLFISNLKFIVFISNFENIY